MAIADVEVKIATSETLCASSSCEPHDTQKHFDIVKIPSGQKEFTWRKDMSFKNRKYSYMVNFTQQYNGKYFIYSSINQYSSDLKKFTTSSGGSLANDLSSEFWTQIQAPQDVEANEFMTSLIVISDKSSNP